MTVELVATGSDFRGFVAEQGVPYAEFMTADYGFDSAAKSVPIPTFHPVAIAGRTNGVPIAHGLTHPGYLRDDLSHDGHATPVNWNLLQQPGVGTPVVSVGYGLNWTKLHGTKPTSGLGPQTDLGGGNEMKRIARLGPIKNLFRNSLVPRQDVKKGDDVVCFGDSGSPLFLDRNGVVEPAIAAALAGATNWCQGSMDPYCQIDRQEAQDFL